MTVETQKVIAEYPAIARIAAEGLPSHRPVMETRERATTYAGTGRVYVDEMAWEPDYHQFNPRTVVKSTDWRPHWQFMRLISLAGRELTSTLVKQRNEMDFGPVHQCIVNLALATKPAQSAFRDVWITRADARHNWEADKAANSRLLATLRTVAGCLCESDLEIISGKILTVNSKKTDLAEKLGMVVRLCRWSGFPLGEDNSRLFLEKAEALMKLREGRDIFFRPLLKFISGSIHGVRPILTLNEKMRRASEKINL